MRLRWIVLLAVLALCAWRAGMMWFAISNRIAALQAQVAQLTADNTKLNADITAATEKAETLEAESAQLRAARAMAGDRLEPTLPPPPAPAPAQAQSPPPQQDGYYTRMFKDPGMRGTLAAQQAMQLRGLYADFLKEVSLTPDETGRFFQILDDRQMALLDSSANAMSGGTVDMKAAAAASDVAEDALKGLLGPDRFALYRQFEKTLGPRVQVAQFNQQLAGQGVPLREYQSAALIQIITEENASIPALAGAAGPGQTSAAVNDYAQQIDAANERVYHRAKSVLAPDQLRALATFQKNMAATEVAGLRVARQMLDDNQ